MNYLICLNIDKIIAFIRFSPNIVRFIVKKKTTGQPYFVCWKIKYLCSYISILKIIHCRTFQCFTSVKIIVS